MVKKKPGDFLLDTRVSESTHVNVATLNLQQWQVFMSDFNSSFFFCHSLRSSNNKSLWCMAVSFVRQRCQKPFLKCHQSTTKKHLHYLPWYLDPLYLEFCVVLNQWNKQPQTSQPLESCCLPKGDVGEAEAAAVQATLPFRPDQRSFGDGMKFWARTTVGYGWMFSFSTSMSCLLLFFLFSPDELVGGCRFWQFSMAIVAFFFVFWTVGWFPGMKEDVSFVLVFPLFDAMNFRLCFAETSMLLYMIDQEKKQQVWIMMLSLVPCTHTRKGSTFFKISRQSLNAISYWIATLGATCQKMPWKTCLSEEEQARGKTWTEEDWSRIRPGWNRWHG